MTKLYIIEGPGRGHSFELEKETLFVGRSPKNDIQISDQSISNRHLKIVKEQDRFFIEDLKSTNGTYLNGEMINPEKQVEVKEGYPIALGNTLMCLDEEFTLEGTLIHHAIKFPRDRREKRALLPSPDRPMTSIKNLQLLYRVSNVLMQSFDINETLEKIMEYLFDCLKRIDRGAILLLDNQTGKLSEIIARSRSNGGHTVINYSHSIVNRVIEDAKPIIMSDTNEAEKVVLSDSIKTQRIRSVMCVPLISRSEIRGAIYVDSVNVPHGFRKDDLYLLTGLSSPAAVAIENALLYTNLEKVVESRTRTLKGTEQRLRKSEGRFRAIFDKMKNGVVVYKAEDQGGDFTILDLNLAAQGIEKLDRDDVTGKSVLTVFPGYEEHGLKKVFERVWESGASEHIPPCFYQDGRISGWREYDVFRLPSGEIVSLYSDVTAEKRAEEEQRALHKQLQDSQKLESIGRLAGGVAHNFRNILQAILGNVEYLEMLNGEESEVKEVTYNINNSVNKGAELVSSLLHFSKQGEAIQPVILDLGDVIRETYNIVSKLFDKKTIITLNVKKDLYVEGNHSLLSQVFMNLFTNAKDAMPDGGEVLVNAWKAENQVIAVVSDTGHGMDKETLEKIFDPFFTLKEVGKGTGLGLSTTHGVIEQHKGTISVSSTPGVGTTFRICLPASEEGTRPSSVPDQKILFGKGEKVLVVDDERSSLDVISQLITKLGYQVISVDRPLDAIKNYQKLAPDIVLMDRSMPELDGIGCIKMIKRTDPGAKIVIVSGYEESGPDGIDEKVRGLIEGYLTKPCGIEELSRTLSRVLGK